jgi:hypothetical protein
MSKFLLNLPLQISKALVNSKIQFLIEKSFFSCFRPGQPCGPFGLWPSQPTGNAVPRMPKLPRPAHPAARRSRLRGKYVFLFSSRLPELAASPSSLYQPGPICQMCLPHHAGRSLPLSSVPSGHPAPPDLRPRDAQQGKYPAP